jgi:hypothetical protein
MKPSGPPDSLRARVLEDATRVPSPPRAATRRYDAATIAAGIALLAIVFAVIGGADFSTRPLPFLVLTLVGWVAIALLATWGGVGRGGSMLGRSARVLVTVAVVTGPGLLAWMLLGTSMYPGTMGFPASVRLHVACFASTVLMAVGAFAALVIVRRGTDPVHPRVSGAALGAVAGAWAGVMIDLHCPVSDTLHVAMAHLVPELVLALTGALLGRRLLGVR